MPDVTYELVYFSARGRPEPTRLLLTLAGVPFTNTAVADWPAHKPTTPLGQLPYLIERRADGTEKRIPQHPAILRHLARVHGLYGRNEDEHTACDVVIEQALDAVTGLSAFAHGPNRGKDVAGLNKYLDHTAPLHLERLNRLLERSPAREAGFFVRDEPTVADVAAFNALDLLRLVDSNGLDRFPALKAFHERILALPALQDYLASRPRDMVADLAKVRATGEPL